jgi:uncharacterized membrane protein
MPISYALNPEKLNVFASGCVQFSEVHYKMFEMFRLIREVPESVLEWVEIAAIFIEVVAVMIILFALIHGSVKFIVNIIQRNLTPRDRFRQYKHGLAKSLLLSLEILVAADVIRTVALQPTLPNILGLGLLVVIRTFLSWSLLIEMEGHWPWQPRPSEE